MQNAEMSRRQFLQFCLVAPLLSHTDRYLPKERRWTIPSVAEIRENITTEPFLRNTAPYHSLFTSQKDPSEYAPKTLLHPSIMNNACGPALVTTTLKLYSYFENGTVPNVTIQSVRDSLLSKQYKAFGGNHAFIEPDNTMYLSSVKAAVDAFSTDFHIKTQEFTSTPLQGFAKTQVNPTRIMTPNEIHTLAHEAQDVFKKGGVVAAFVYKYGWGHFVLFSNMYLDENNHTRVFVIDSLGTSNRKQGTIQDALLLTYLPRSYNGTPMLFSAFGIYPTYTKPQS